MSCSTASLDEAANLACRLVLRRMPGDSILSMTEADTDAFDSMLDSNALPGSALTEVALDPGEMTLRAVEGCWNLNVCLAWFR